MRTGLHATRPPSVAVPSVAVIDNFAQKMVDIDGDGTPDLSHGETVVRLLRARHPKVRITPFPFQKSLIRRNNQNSGLQPADKFRDLTGALDELKKAMQAGDRFDAVNLASGEYLPLPARKPRFWEKRFWRENNRALNSILKKLETVTKSVPVYLPAGNFRRDDAFNALSLAKNINTVAATDANGRLAEYSMDNARVNRYARGTYAVTKIPGGFDISGDQKIDVYDGEVSGGTPFSTQFVGRKLTEVLAPSRVVNEMRDILREKHSTPQAARYNLYGYSPASRYLFDVDDLFAINALPKAEYHYIRSLGRYVSYLSSDAWRNGVWEVFDVNAEGKVVYHPDGSGREAVNRIWGTSWAGPTALAEDLSERFRL